MSTQVQYRRGTGAQNNSFTGALAEITVDTTNWTLRIHDGVTAGGAGNLATVAYVDAEIGGLSANSISDGTSSVTIIATNGNVRANVGGSTVQLLSSGGANITGYVTATGNITGDYILGNGSQLTGIDATSIQSGTSNVRVLSSGGNVSVGVGGSAIVRFTTDGIVNDMGNGVGNIGNATGQFNTIFAKATSAQYADVAEKYLADQNYEPGTVVEIGGAAEVTHTNTFASTRIAGVVSTDPAFIMNSGAAGDHVVTIALLGRVPCLVAGRIRRGDLLCSSTMAGHAVSLPADQYRPGAVIGKALEDHDQDGTGQIEVLVGRL